MYVCSLQHYFLKDIQGKHDAHLCNKRQHDVYLSCFMRCHFPLCLLTPLHTFFIVSFVLVFSFSFSRPYSNLSLSLSSLSSFARQPLICIFSLTSHSSSSLPTVLSLRLSLCLFPFFYLLLLLFPPLSLPLSSLAPL